MDKVCNYCKERMTYGIQIEVLSKGHQIKYEQLGWRCSMKTDYCDIVFDEKDKDINTKKYNEANEKLDK